MQNLRGLSPGFARSVFVILAIALLAGLVLLWPVDDAGDGERHATPALLRIGVLPDQSPESLRRRFTPLLDYLSMRLNIEVELRLPGSYQDLLDQFHAQEIDLAYFGGYAYIKANQLDQARALVMRRIDTRFTSVFVVAAGSDARELVDTRGQRIGFGSQLSTSGHLMPRYFLEQMGMVPEDFFSRVDFSGAHDRTAFWVRDGIVDVGALNATTFRSMLEDNRLEPGQLSVLWETPPYADYVWALHPSVGDDLGHAIRDAFLALSPDRDDHRAILDALDASGFIPADPSYFENLETIVRSREAASAPD